MTTTRAGVDAALKLHERGLHVFPVDHPHHPQCIGKHGPTAPCDGHRGKHPAVKWSVWAVAATPQMIEDMWGRYRGLANIGVACGPSNLVILDEDAAGELERWCVTYGITLPDTYTVTTARGRHLYFRWDHSTQPIGNSPKAMEGFTIDVRGHGGFAVAEGSRHADGELYIGNGQPIATLPAEVAALLLAGSAATNGHGDAAWEHHEGRDYDTAKIGYPHRHNGLVAYAGRLRKSGLDRAEAEPAFRQRWLCCEQPAGQIPEARYHSPEVPYPVTWEEAEAKLRDVFTRYAAGQNLNGAVDPGDGGAEIDEEAFWTAYDELQDCRAYARAVRVGPWAMLGAALAITAATIPPHMVLPGVVGDYASVNLYVNLPGESGKIKSAAISAARAWLHTTPTPAPIKPGSGQGIAKCFAYVKRPRNGVPTQIGKRWTAVAVIPEIDTLTAAGSLSSSNLWAEFRSAWSDERLGHDYADAEKAIILQPRRYRLCMIVGVQPLRAQPLLDDIDAGTPQRFCWFPVDDPGAPEARPDQPEPLELARWPQDDLADYADIDDFRAQKLHLPADRGALAVLPIPPEAIAVIDTVAREKLRNNPDVDPLDGHRLLCQLKVAAALMRLCNRTAVTLKDWELAGTVMAVSDRTREQVRAKLAAATARRNLDAAQAAGTRKVVETRILAEAEAEDIARVAEVIVTALTGAAGHSMPGHKVTKAVNSRDRHLVPRALEYLEVDGRIDVQNFEYRGRPAVKITLLDDKEQQTK